MTPRHHADRPQPVFLPFHQPLHPIVVGAAERSSELTLDISRDAELRGEQELVVDAFLVVVGEPYVHVVAADLTPCDVSSVPILGRVIDAGMAEMRHDFFRPRLELVLELGADVLLAGQPHRREMRELALQPIDLVHDVFFPQVGIHVEDLHSALLFGGFVDLMKIAVIPGRE
jgi:hypothetical protein